MTRPLSAEQYWKEYFDRIRRQREDALDRLEHHRQITREMDAIASGGVPRERSNG